MMNGGRESRKRYARSSYRVLGVFCSRPLCSYRERVRKRATLGVFGTLELQGSLCFQNTSSQNLTLPHSDQAPRAVAAALAFGTAQPAHRALYTGGTKGRGRTIPVRPAETARSFRRFNAVRDALPHRELRRRKIDQSAFSKIACAQSRRPCRSAAAASCPATSRRDCETGHSLIKVLPCLRRPRSTPPLHSRRVPPLAPPSPS